MLKLQAMLEQPDDEAHALRVLRRLSMAPITAQLEATTGLLAFMVEQSTDERLRDAAQAGAEEAARAATLATSIVRAWQAQLAEEQKQREAAQQRKAGGSVAVLPGVVAVAEQRSRATAPSRSSCSTTW